MTMTELFSPIFCEHLYPALKTDMTYYMTMTAASCHTLT